MDRRLIHFAHAFFRNEQALVALLADQDALRFPFLTTGRVSSQAADLFTRFVSRPKAQQKAMAEEDPDQVIESFIQIVLKGSQQRSLMKYLLPTLDALLVESLPALRSLRGQPKDSLQKLIRQLRGLEVLADKFGCEQIQSALHIQSLLFEQRGQTKEVLELLDRLNKLYAGGKIRDYSYLLSLNPLIKHTRVARTYFSAYSLTAVSRIVKGGEPQVVYTLLVTIWLLSFVKEIRGALCSRSAGLLKFLCEQTSKLHKQKILRISFKIIENLKDQPECIETLVDCGMLKTIDSLSKGFIQDQDLIKQMSDLGELLESNIRVLTSLDRYKRELDARLFEWGHLHSQKFWKEHVKKFEEEDFGLVRRIIELLRSDNCRTAAVACFDLGEFSRFYPYGKRVLETLGGKDEIMKLAKDSESKEGRQVREQALLALQKIMINNWETL